MHGQVVAARSNERHVQRIAAPQKPKGRLLTSEAAPLGWRLLHVATISRMLSSHRWNRNQDGGRLAAGCSAYVGGVVADPIPAGRGCGRAAPSVHGVDLVFIQRRLLPRVNGIALGVQTSADDGSIASASAAGNFGGARGPGGRGWRLAAGMFAAVSPLHVSRAEVLDQLLAAERGRCRFVAAGRMPVEFISWAKLSARGTLPFPFALGPCTCIMR